MFDTVFLELSHAAIASLAKGNALVYFFSEPLGGNLLEGKCRQNAPCPDPIVPFQMERRGQSAKTLVSS
jgi:hypothetical protein